MRELLVEKYRPKTVKDYLFPNDNAEQNVKKWVREKQIPNLLLSSGPGQGKTTLAYVLINELGIDESDVKYINASMTNGIGFIREELEPWMKKASFSAFKVVVLDELCRMSPQAQDSLKNLIESSSKSTRFIATANHPNRITEALQSRFQKLDMDGVSEESVVDLVVKILEEEEIEPIEDEFVLEHIEMHYPDMRAIINSIDQSTDSENRLGTPIGFNKSSGSVDDWDAYWSQIEKPDDIVLNEVIELTEAVDNMNYQEFYDVMYKNRKAFPDVSTAVVMLAKYNHMAITAANQRLCLEACIYNMYALED